MLTPKERAPFLATLKARFEKHPHRHQGLSWSDVLHRLEKHPAKLVSLHAMETSDGEPDVIGHDPQTGQYRFVDCSPETPKARTSLCYDDEALHARKEHKPKNSAIGMAKAIGADILTEDQYRNLQLLGEFDLKTSTWILTPPDIRNKGGALFCDRRYGQVFTYHNGAQSYYAVRGFRCLLKI